MSRIYDNWERLVAATLKREQYYELCFADSRATSISSSMSSSDYNFPSPAAAAFSVIPSQTIRVVSRDLFQTPDDQPNMPEVRTNRLINMYRHFRSRYNLYKTYTVEQEKVMMTEEVFNPRSTGDAIADALQLAMTRLEDEFRRLILIRNTTVPLDSPGSFHHHSSTLSSSAAAIAIAVTEFLNVETNEGLDDVSTGRRYIHDWTDVSFAADEAVNDLREIADKVICSGYEKECWQVYYTVRRDVLDKCMLILGVEKTSNSEEVQRRRGWPSDDKMQKWTRAVKLVVRVLLSNERHLCDEIFAAGSDLIKQVCFLRTSEDCVMQLLKFGEAIAIGTRFPENLFRILDMYDALSEVLPDLQALFTDEENGGGMVCREAKMVLDGLGEAAIGSLVELENTIQKEGSKMPMQEGEIHPLARYVMNYAKLLVVYSSTLNSLLENLDAESGQPDRENNGNAEGESTSLIVRRLLALITSLESNMEDISRLYEDSAMQFIFLMNNTLYIVQDVKSSELQNLLGDNWIRERRERVQQYAMQYLRASWGRALSCFKDEGLRWSSIYISKVAVKERFQNFNAYFEDIYEIQTAWNVPDPELREELRISISGIVIPAYRSFKGRFEILQRSKKKSGRCIKYTPEDLEKYLLDLFEGKPLSLRRVKRQHS